MLAAEHWALKQEMERRGIVFSFSGYLSEGVLFSLGETLKHKMTADETDKNTVKKVFSVFVEQVQNIIRYSAERVEAGNPSQKVELTSGIVIVGMENGRFYVVCANPVRKRDAERLQERLDHLRGLDKDGLKALYKERLKDESDAESKGASIGLIEIARRASQPIDYDVMAINDENLFFSIKAYI